VSLATLAPRGLEKARDELRAWPGLLIVTHAGEPSQPAGDPVHEPQVRYCTLGAGFFNHRQPSQNMDLDLECKNQSTALFCSLAIFKSSSLQVFKSSSSHQGTDEAIQDVHALDMSARPACRDSKIPRLSRKACSQPPAPTIPRDFNFKLAAMSETVPELQYCFKCTIFVLVLLRR
jgi:hypothetical protein